MSNRFTPLSNLSPEIRQELEDMLDIELYNEGVENVNAVTEGALSVDVKTTFLTVSGTKAYTLADGEWEGQQKVVYVKAVGATGTPDGTLTPADPGPDYSTVTLDAEGEALILEWHDSTGWIVVGVRGATVNS